MSHLVFIQLTISRPLSAYLLLYMLSRMRRRRKSERMLNKELKSINMSLDSSMLHMTIFTRDIIHAIVMTCLAFFNQQQTLFRRQSVKSEDMTKFNGVSETCSVLQYPQRLSSFRPYSHCHHTHLLGIDGILRMRW